jgi:3'-5' exoribonuclease
MLLRSENLGQTPLREWGADTPVSAVLLVRAAERRHRSSGDPYVRLTLADRSATIPGVLWDLEGAPAVKPGDPVAITGRCAEHPRYGRQLTIETLRRPPADAIPWDDLLVGPARPVGELCDELDALIGSILDPHLSRLIVGLLDPATPTGRAYRDAPAAKYNHHAYRAGLLEHSVGIAQVVSAAAAVFDGVDRDLAVCGALLHDIGKLEAYAGENGCAELTDAGKLEGEIPLGYYRVRREIETTPGFPAELAQALLHVILAHHGCLEHGSPVVPGTREAALVHAIDNLSGQFGAFDRLAKEAAPGERWSRYDRVLGGSAFLGSRAALGPALAMTTRDVARPARQVEASRADPTPEPDHGALRRSRKRRRTHRAPPASNPVQQANRSPFEGEDLAFARAFIAACRFTYARTVPEHPHEYCLRDWVDGEAFDRFAAMIAAHGYPGSFWQQHWTYLDVDGWKYWRSNTLDSSGGLIVNRARLLEGVGPPAGRARSADHASASRADCQVPDPASD